MNIPMIKLPTYELILPSTQETIRYRPYTVREEKILVLAMQSNNDDEIKRAMGDIVKSCTFDKVDINENPMFDVQYVFLKLRCKSVGEVSEVILTCASCEDTHRHFINLDTINVVFKADTKNILDFGDFKIEMKYPNLSDLSLIKSDNDVDSIFKMIVSCVKKIYTDEEMIENTKETQQSIQEILEMMVPEQFMQVQNFFNNVPALVHTINFTCEKCSTDNHIDVTGIYNFFL